MAYSVCMAFITVVFVISLFAQYQVKLDLNAQERDVKAQLSQQEKVKKRLTNEADNQDSPEVIEKIAREKLNMVKPNEIVFVDDNQDENTTSSPLTTTKAATSDGE
ncbi:MAG: FtsB family cell division protein [Lachnospirales bacterium]|jgi:cell division protein DivIC|nr:septum formation initiator family protein [Clostridia bacterium]